MTPALGLASSSEVRHSEAGDPGAITDDTEPPTLDESSGASAVQPTHIVSFDDDHGIHTRLKQPEDYEQQGTHDFNLSNRIVDFPEDDEDESFSDGSDFDDDEEAADDTGPHAGPKDLAEQHDYSTTRRRLQDNLQRPSPRALLAESSYEHEDTSRKSVAIVWRNVIKELQKELHISKLVKGHVYALRDPELDLVKFGWCEITISRRRDKVQSECHPGKGLTIIAGDDHISIYEYRRLERLIHLDLKLHRKCFLCACGANKNTKHREWFKISDEVAIETLHVWKSLIRRNLYGIPTQLSEKGYFPLSLEWHCKISALKPIVETETGHHDHRARLDGWIRLLKELMPDTQEGTSANTPTPLARPIGHSYNGKNRNEVWFPPIADPGEASSDSSLSPSNAITNATLFKEVVTNVLESQDSSGGASLDEARPLLTSGAMPSSAPEPDTGSGQMEQIDQVEKAPSRGASLRLHTRPHLHFHPTSPSERENRQRMPRISWSLEEKKSSPFPTPA